MTLTPKDLRKLAFALPFADEERGMPETIAALRWAADKIEELEAVLAAYRIVPKEFADGK